MEKEKGSILNAESSLLIHSIPFFYWKLNVECENPKKGIGSLMGYSFFFFRFYFETLEVERCTFDVGCSFFKKV